MLDDTNPNEGADNADNNNVDTTANNNAAPSTSESAPATTTDTGFKIPDEYKDAAWAKNYKSSDDLWKAHANAQSLIGKKTVGTPDWNDPKAVEEYYAKVRPADAKSYKFDESMPKEHGEFFGQTFHKHGLSEKQAEGLYKDVTEWSVKEHERMYGANSFKDVLLKEYNNDEKVIEQMHKDASAIFGEGFVDNKNLTNAAIVELYKAAQTIKKQYGIKELTANVNSPASIPGSNPADIDKSLNETHKKILELDGKQGRIEEVNKLKKEYQRLQKIKFNIKE